MSSSSDAERMLDACILPLSPQSHKGSSGRIGILGGSERYTGAPYYAGMASLKVGADLAYIFCAQEAAIPIKSYSPELMVAPVYSAREFTAAASKEGGDDDHVKQLTDSMVEEVVSMMDKLHVLVVGPGLGRCPLVMKATWRILREAIARNLLVVVDADGLFLLTQEPYRKVFLNYEKVVLTPNVMEYKRLLEANDGDLTKAFDKAIIVKKGAQDIIYKDGQEAMVCDEQGGLKRSGGIGDVLAGTLGTFLAWNEILPSPVDRVWSCWCACYLVKRSTKFAYERKGRSMTAPDVLESIWANVDDRSGSKL